MGRLVPSTMGQCGPAKEQEPVAPPSYKEVAAAATSKAQPAPEHRAKATEVYQQQKDECVDKTMDKAYNALLADSDKAKRVPMCAFYLGFAEGLGCTTLDPVQPEGAIAKDVTMDEDAFNTFMTTVEK